MDHFHLIMLANKAITTRRREGMCLAGLAVKLLPVVREIERGDVGAGRVVIVDLSSRLHDLVSADGG